ncbi:MAG: hypothetical protein KAS13_03280 [Candidatus Omnitrophica bacterium]|nr:hypothetical protein [Candidatus Omnitrophota bacterium]
MRFSTILLVICLLLVNGLSFAQDKDENPSLIIFLFSSSSCPQCEQLKNDFLPKILQKFQSRVDFQHIAVDSKDSFALQLLYEKKFGIEDSHSTKIFVGEQYLSGIKDIRKGLERLINEELAKKSRTVTPQEILAKKNESLDVRDLIEDKFSRLNFTIVGLAGLVDGVNPCAFVTILFFISILTLLKKSKKTILIVGTSFAFSVFMTYLLLGLGVFKAIKVISTVSGVARFISLASAAAAFIIAGYNFMDLFRFFKSHNSNDIKAKLPKSVRKVINRLISRKMRTENLVLAALGLGVTVSLLESVCTGQVYLPTIIYILQQKQNIVIAVCYLIFYNIMFIVPLLCVFGLAFSGVSSLHVRRFFTQHLALSKLLLATLFCLLGILLLRGQITY